MAICISHGKESKGAIDTLAMYAKHGGDCDGWTMPKTAQREDILLIYIGAPEGALVAKAVVDCDEPSLEKRGEYKGKYMGKIKNIKMLTPRIGLQILRKEIPGWGKTKSPLRRAMTLKIEQDVVMRRILKMPPAALSESQSSDTGKLPPRVQATVSRLVRDTKLSTKIKALHNNRCQIKTCKHPVVLADGSHYAEGHHIQPLGDPHNGPDVAGNIICLCPNHHAACDLRAIQLVASELRKVKGHEIDPKFIKYHNQKILKKPSKSKN